MSTKFPRSPYDTIHGLVYFLRMIDKIRLHAAGVLGGDYVANLGIHFDLRCCTFLGIDYAEFTTAVRSGLSDEEAWDWAVRHGVEPTEEQIEVWNAFMTKRGWRDEGTASLRHRLQEGGFEKRTDIQTTFDFIDLDEGRPLRALPAA